MGYINSETPVPDTQRFLPGACERIDQVLTGSVVGQDLAVSQLVDAVCAHLQQRRPVKPLIVSVHGVGKTYTHTLLARALYNADPERAVRCPGHDCRGAKVIYGLDFMLDSREAQLAAVRSAILEHARSVSDPLIVIEEYDKLDCASRGMLRQLMASPDIANATLNRAIVLLESNLGFLDLEALAVRIGRDKVTAEQAEKALRDKVFSAWLSSSCEDYSDTLKMLSLIDFFLPYFPLERKQVEQIMTRALQQWALRLWHEKHTQMEWGPEVLAFLTDRVDFDGPFPLEGGKQVAHVATRHVSRLVRKCPLHEGPPAAKPAAAAASAAVGAQLGAVQRGPGAPGSPVMRLVVQGQALGVELPRGEG